MLQLSGFADEIGPDLGDQIRVCRETGVTHLELRSVDKVNVLNLSPDRRREILDSLRGEGMGVVSIGSPCGKKPATDDETELMDMFKKALEAAVAFEAPLIRVFSFYPHGGEGAGPVEEIRDRSIELLRKQASILDESGTDVVMVHENEKGIYGDTGDRCLDLMQSVDSPRFRTAFDFANFIQVGDDPAENWPKLKQFTSHIHIKDAKKGSGEVVPAGEGDGSIGAILKDAYDGGYRGFVSMEPHLKVAGHSHGETGPELWTTAVTALRKVCDEAGVPLAS
jgi:sugar phosphate isomerase/epimerase